jgi:hypothetical protein
MAKGPSPLEEIADLAGAAEWFNIESNFDLADGATLDVWMYWQPTAYGGKMSFGFWVFEGGVPRPERSVSGEFRPCLTAGFREVAERFPTATLRPESVKVSVRNAGISPIKAKRMVVQAWYEAFARPVPETQDVVAWERAERERMQDEAQAMLGLLKTGQPGVTAFNQLGWEKQARIDLRHQDFSGCDLRGLCLKPSTSVEGARFVDACLADCGLYGCDGRGTDFSRCDLTGTMLERAKLQNAIFQAAVLRGTRLSGAHVEGADFTRATIEDCRWSASTRFDENTRWPQGFSPPAVLKWEGKGPDPRLLATAGPELAPGSKPFAAFLKHLKETSDEGKLERAFSMLREDRFQLFSEVTADHLAGVVKSQTDASLVYACRLEKHGTYACCTQNLNPCGGLRGSPCKHLLVLIVGLVRVGELNAKSARTWLKAAQGKKAALDKDVMTETLIRYKGAEAGDIDWRPTETIPEDFYSM